MAMTITVRKVASGVLFRSCSAPCRIAHLLVEYVALTRGRVRRRFRPFWRIAPATAAARGVAQAIELAAELANLVHCVALIHPECLHADGRR